MIFSDLFLTPKPLIGVIHLPPLPGHAGRPGITRVTEKALEDLATLEAAGFNGILVENDGDDPPYFEHNQMTSHIFGAVMKVLRTATKLPLGLEILYDMPGTIMLASEVGADFVRLDVFVDDVQHARGPIIKAQGKLLHELRLKLNHKLLLFTDVQVKHTTLLDPTKSLGRSAVEAAEAGSDALIITGTWTGNQANLADAITVKQIVSIPVLVGSGLDANNAATFLPTIDGAIIASSIKTGAYVDAAKAKQLAAVVHGIAAVA